jgi:hypothetical protein
MINPAQLPGLKQAAFVMECLVRGRSDEEIVKMLGGDEQLFNMWKLFLKHNEWIEETFEGYSITGKGMMWNKRITSA